jgi:hypothetical protein
MKTKVLFLAALLIAAVSVTSVAKEDPTNVTLAVVPVKGSAVYKVIYKKEGSTRVKVNLYNSAGKVVFTETINQDGFIRPLNFAGLAPGEYTFEAIDGDSKVVEKILYKTEISVPSDKLVHVSKINGEDQRFVLSIANAKNEAFVVNIYGQNGEVIFTENTTVDGSDAKIYNVKNGKVSRVEVIDAAGVSSGKKF